MPYVLMYTKRLVTISEKNVLALNLWNPKLLLSLLFNFRGRFFQYFISGYCICCNFWGFLKVMTWWQIRSYLLWFPPLFFLVIVVWYWYFSLTRIDSWFKPRMCMGYAWGIIVEVPLFFCLFNYKLGFWGEVGILVIWWGKHTIDFLNFYFPYLFGVTFIGVLQSIFASIFTIFIIWKGLCKIGVTSFSIIQESSLLKTPACGFHF